ncbi:unnamed protein product [Rotaria sordida]|uniref:FERM domain-containing protein n=1 Tax=Rotaria sordida TaxID=392033 RepID=A0A814G5Z5_9BILA|nr:unnamed protein product [Rotaria sordida]CAF1017224.1 unnamed protein product [Rotaria sordida]CAF3898227.1 unnamed protein product [Rotaria sordida]CAF3917755.1 unnamed protein product [Rotaria sordida]
MSSSSATNSSLSSFSDECETFLPEPPPPPPPPPPIPSANIKINECIGGKKLVHKIEPIFNNDTTKMRIFLEDGSLTEYSIGDLTTAEELIEEVAFRHSLGSDIRRYRLTLNEARDTSWRSIRYIRPQQKLKEVSQWPCTTETTICTLRVVIVPYQAEILADTEPITFTYLYRQSINDYVRERAGSEISIDTAVQLTALLILDESLCTGVRVNTLVKRSWLLRQLLPRTLLDQFSLKQLINRVRAHLHDNNDMTQLNVAKQFIRIFSENTRSFGGKLFPVKFPDKHRDSILLVGARYPIGILDQARRINSPVMTLVSTWSHLSRVTVKQYRNGVAIRLLTTPRTTIADDSSILQQEIAFLIHTNLLNDFMAFIEGYSQLESLNFPLSIERISHKSKSPSSSTNKSKLTSSSNEYQSESFRRSPLLQHILNNRKNHRKYTLTQGKHISPSTSPSLFELTRQFFTRNPTKTIDIDERETVSNVPNRTTLVTWRSIADSQTSTTTATTTTTTTPPPPPVLYRTVINVKHSEQMISISDDDGEPDVIDLTTSHGYYGTISFPIRPPSPFADGLIWSDMSNQCKNEDEDTDGVVIWSPSTKQLTVHYNRNNNNNNNNVIPYSPTSSRTDSTWKRTLDRILKRTKAEKDIPQITTCPYDFGNGEDLITTDQNSKHVHWIDNNEIILNACRRFVEHLKIFVQNVINGQNEEIYLKNCQISLNELNSLIDCSELKQAFEDTIELANKYDKNQLLQQQTFIAHLISRTILSS